jgi:hypothetical protein
MNNDLIDRTALLRKWDEKFFAMGADRLGRNGDEIMQYLNSLLDEIKNAPTVEPETSRLALIEDIRKKQMDADKAFLEGYERGKNERPQGEWILNKDENPECPFCHHSFTYWGNYCPNCGADMRGEKE